MNGTAVNSTEEAWLEARRGEYDGPRRDTGRRKSRMELLGGTRKKGRGNRLGPVQCSWKTKNQSKGHKIGQGARRERSSQQGLFSDWQRKHDHRGGPKTVGHCLRR
ncbi:hypothetical protein TRVL_06502 [Trypanosoma vivax]|nr:hypothetical protein TRVL_06502 [Trypanosoma vivax]